MILPGQETSDGCAVPHPAPASDSEPVPDSKPGPYRPRAAERRPQRVLVTGACGSLGTPVCQALRRRGYDVIGVDRRAPGQEGSCRDIEHHTLDITNFRQLVPLFEQVDSVVHTAAQHGLHLKFVEKEHVFCNNLLSLFHVLAASRRAGVRRVVVTSSTSIYGASEVSTDKARWYDEETPVRWTDHYDASKVMGEDLCNTYCGSKLDIISLRTARFFFDDDVPYNVRKLYRGVDLRDAVLGHCLAVEAPAAGGHRVFNIAAKSPFRRRDSLELFRSAPQVIERYYPGVEELFRTRGWQLPESIDRVFDISKAESELGYVPRHNFDQFFAAHSNAVDSGALAHDRLSINL